MWIKGIIENFYIKSFHTDYKKLIIKSHKRKNIKSIIENEQ